MTAGDEMMAFIAEAYPICRSITGDGVRRTLAMIGERIPLEIREVPTGTPVFDWTVPREWNIRDAWIKDPSGRKVVDFQEYNLHVLSYSVPVHEKLPLAELKKHLFTLPDKPDLIPYRTSYYKETWGFCLRHRTLEALPEGEYEVCDRFDPRGRLAHLRRAACCRGIPSGRSSSRRTSATRRCATTTFPGSR